MAQVRVRSPFEAVQSVAYSFEIRHRQIQLHGRRQFRHGGEDV